jgi:hypothetical protein
MAKSTENIIISRKKKETKSVAVSLRLTKTERRFIENLKSNLRFETIPELLLFCAEVTKTLKEWNAEGYTFIISNPKTGNFKEVSFEFSPQ